MSKIYAVIGTSQQTIIADSIRYTPSENEVRMKSERPNEGEYIANENGEWVVPEPTVEEQLAELDARYNAKKTEYTTAYTAAVMKGDTETAEAIKGYLDTLDDDYDAEYDRIVGEEE